MDWSTLSLPADWSAVHLRRVLRETFTDWNEPPWARLTGNALKYRGPESAVKLCAWLEHEGWVEPFPGESARCRLTMRGAGAMQARLQRTARPVFLARLAQVTQRARWVCTRSPSTSCHLQAVGVFGSICRSEQTCGDVDGWMAWSLPPNTALPDAAWLEAHALLTQGCRGVDLTWRPEEYCALDYAGSCWILAGTRPASIKEERCDPPDPAWLTTLSDLPPLAESWKVQWRLWERRWSSALTSTVSSPAPSICASRPCA